MNKIKSNNKENSCQDYNEEFEVKKRQIYEMLNSKYDCTIPMQSILGSLSQNSIETKTPKANKRKLQTSKSENVETPSPKKPTYESPTRQLLNERIEDLKKAYTNFEQYKNNSKCIVKYHCKHLSEEVTSATDDIIINLQQIRDNMLQEIATYRKECLRSVENANKNDKTSTQAIENAKEYVQDKKTLKDVDTVAELKRDIQKEKLRYQKQIFSNKSIRYIRPDRFMINNVLQSSLKETPFTKLRGYNIEKLNNSIVKPIARANLKIKTHKDEYFMAAFGHNLIVNAFQVNNTIQLQLHDTDANYIAAKSLEGQVIDICANFQFIFVLCQTNVNGKFLVRKYDRKLSFILFMTVENAACGISCNDSDVFVVFNEIDDDMPLRFMQKGRIDYKTRVEIYDCDFLVKFKSMDVSCRQTYVDDNENIINFEPKIKLFNCGNYIFAVYRSEFLTKIECISCDDEMVLSEFCIDEPVHHIEFDGVDTFVYVSQCKITAVDCKGDFRASAKFIETHVDDCQSERFFKTFCLTNDGCIAMTTNNLMLKIY